MSARFCPVTKVTQHIDDKFEIPTHFENVKPSAEITNVEFYFEPNLIWTSETHNHKCIR